MQLAASPLPFGVDADAQAAFRSNEVILATPMDALLGVGCEVACAKKSTLIFSVLFRAFNSRLRINFC